MEISDLVAYYTGLLTCFKIDGIVWKYETGEFTSVVESGFKIDGIVWKSRRRDCNGSVSGSFKIDGIVWKLDSTVAGFSWMSWALK